MVVESPGLQTKIERLSFQHYSTILICLVILEILKILFLSALAVPELTCILADVNTTNEILRKPVALDDLISAVNTVLNG